MKRGLWWMTVAMLCFAAGAATAEEPRDARLTEAQAAFDEATKLKDAGFRTGVLSNTCESHWRFILAHFKGLFPGAFDVLALSFRLGAAKPDERIFTRAAELAGVAPGDIFYCDDIAANVAAARRVGYDAVQYTDTAALVAEIRKRGVRFNY